VHDTIDPSNDRSIEAQSCASSSTRGAPRHLGRDRATKVRKRQRRG